jgi:hypothetical protein
MLCLGVLLMMPPAEHEEVLEVHRLRAPVLEADVVHLQVGSLAMTPWPCLTLSPRHYQ